MKYYILDEDNGDCYGGYNTMEEALKEVEAIVEDWGDDFYDETSFTIVEGVEHQVKVTTSTRVRASVVHQGWQT